MQARKNKKSKEKKTVAQRQKGGLCGKHRGTGRVTCDEDGEDASREGEAIGSGSVVQ